jgi:hypothetical protein
MVMALIVSPIVWRLFFVFGSPMTEVVSAWVRVRLTSRRPSSRPKSSHLRATSSARRMLVLRASTCRGLRAGRLARLQVDDETPLVSRIYLLSGDPGELQPGRSVPGD